MSKMQQQVFLAFDLGATSGRSIIGTLDNNKINIRELTRFPNEIIELNGKYYWNMLALYQALKDALSVCKNEGINPISIGIDTWGVDVVPIAEDGSILSTPRAYRDPYTTGIPENFFKIIPREEVYKKTGIQIVNYNTLFQLYAGMTSSYPPYKHAKEFLFMPDALIYMLSGEKICEYTIASTSQILNPVTKEFDKDLLKAAGYDADVLHKPVLPGTYVGTLSDSLSVSTGLGKVKIVAVAGHDTASAVAAIPALDENFAYLSSGTWSLMGIETKEAIINEDSYAMNFTNEGGVDGTTRFLKNLCGMWILEQCRKEWTSQGKSYSYQDILEMAMSAEPFRAFIQTDDESFANPPSMLNAIHTFCEQTGQQRLETDAQIMRCIFESLAMRYREVLDELISIAPFPIERLHIIGGGSQNYLLNQYTANAINKKVIAGPSEATALGNLMMQAVASGSVSSLSEMRSIIKNSVTTEEYEPKQVSEWEEAYKMFKKIHK